MIFDYMGKKELYFVLNLQKDENSMTGDESSPKPSPSATPVSP